MSDNKKYYYLKLKDNFYDQDHIKYIESMENGYIYSNIIMKLYLRSLKHDGCLRITENIPYDPSNIIPLSRVIGHDPSHVGDAINLAIKLGIMIIKDAAEMWFTDIQNYIGHSTTEADRIRKHRAKLNNTNTVQMYDKCTPELELEIELKKEIELDKDKKKASTDAGYHKKDNLIAFLADNSIVMSQERISSLHEWMTYKHEKKQAYKKTGLKKIITQWNDKPDDAFIKAVDNSISCNYSGLFEQKEFKQDNKPLKYDPVTMTPQQYYDMGGRDII